ncbi:MAG TPA: lipid-binding SYLF domain-containing protein [Candidatus Angelobacter sp.]|nr:lipid-binding SYLF domain-containing protein [Candidatus Angelobacter sp.]
MKRFVAFLSVLALATLSWAWTAKDDATERLQRSSEVLTQIAQAPDKGIPDEVLAHAKCIAIVPHLVKGGLGFGGKHGRGVATCRTADGWSAPAFISVGGGSWGLQIGVESVDLIMLVMNDKGMEQLLSSKFQISGEGSAAAGPVGRHASAGTDWKLDTEMLTYSRSKGAFAGLTLEGAVIQQDNDSTTAIYGDNVPFKSILLGKVPAPAVAQPFVQSVSTLRRDVKNDAQR